MWCVLSPIVFDNDGTGEKARWKEEARQKLYNAIEKAAAGTLSMNAIRHSAYKDASPLFDPDATPSEPEHTKSTAFICSYEMPSPKRIERRATIAASTALQIQHESRKQRANSTAPVAKTNQQSTGACLKRTLKTTMGESQTRHQDQIKGNAGDLLAELRLRARGCNGM